MSQADKLNEARLDAMAYAVRKIKEVGLEEFEKELKWRGVYRISASVSMQTMKTWMYELEKVFYTKMYGAFFMKLHDRYGFGKKRLGILNESVSELTVFLIENPYEWENFQKEVEKILREPLELKLIRGPE